MLCLVDLLGKCFFVLDASEPRVCFLPFIRISPFLPFIQLIDERKDGLIFVSPLVVVAVHDSFTLIVFQIKYVIPHSTCCGGNDA